VVTYYGFNHHLGRLPLDLRFLGSQHNLLYYLIDRKRPAQLRDKPVLLECAIDTDLFAAGQRYLAEWSLLLAEARHGFCQYPFFMVSSRFYEKNAWLRTDLNQEWAQMFKLLKTYGWGYLPSYDRAWNWQDLQDYQQRGLLPVTTAGRQLVLDLYGVDIPNGYRYMSDFFCNYIGFQSRAHLLAYVDFYRPLLEHLFDERYQPRQDLSRYVALTRYYRKEKPFTFYLELISHLFFYQRQIKFFGMHYDGYYEVDERAAAIRKIAELADGPAATGASRSLTNSSTGRMENKVRTLLAQRWSPVRLLFDGLFSVRLRGLRRKLGRPERHSA
jgi:hypothetical protein